MRSFSKVLSSISEAIWSVNLSDNTFVYLNERTAEVFATETEEIKKDHLFWQKFIHPEDRSSVIADTEKLKEDKALEIVFRAIIKGNTRRLKLKQEIVFEDDLQSDVLICILTDISKKRNTDYSRPEKTFRYFFIHNPNPLWIYDRKTLAFLEVNHAAIHKYGYSREEFLKKTIADIRPPQDVPLLLESVKKVRNQYFDSKKIWRHAKKNGELLYVAVSGHGIKYKGNDAEIVMAHDITSEIEIRQKITLAKENLDAFINNIEDHIWSVDTNYNIVLTNTAFRSTITDRIGRELHTGESIFLPEFDKKACKMWKKHYDRALAGNTFQFTELVTLPNSEPFFAETKLSPIRVNNKIMGVACISSNIQQRIVEKERMIDYNKKLHELISIASHEIRGPVASIMGLISVFNTEDYTDPFNGQVIEFIQSITLQLDKMIHTLVEKSHALKQDGDFKYFAPQNQSENESL